MYIAQYYVCICASYNIFIELQWLDNRIDKKIRVYTGNFTKDIR